MSREKNGDLPTFGVQATLLIWMRVAASFCLGAALSAIPVDQMSVTTRNGPARVILRRKRLSASAKVPGAHSKRR